MTTARSGPGDEIPLLGFVGDAPNGGVVAELRANRVGICGAAACRVWGVVSEFGANREGGAAVISDAPVKGTQPVPG
jgi:hypothetical protein